MGKHFLKSAVVICLINYLLRFEVVIALGHSETNLPSQVHIVNQDLVEVSFELI